jgi:broad specificity phosphatase PhoE
MSAKTVYFLRHGQTTLNRTLVHQYPDTPLSPEGKGQVRKTAEMLRTVHFDVILTSPYLRTQQTASLVAEVCPAPIEITSLFAELRPPRCLMGKSWFSPHSLFIMGLLFLRLGNDTAHFSDAENFEELHARSRRALEILANRPEKTILVVSHRAFLTALRERIRCDGLDSKKQYRDALLKHHAIKNASYFVAHWTSEGEYGNTLDGTWTIEK